MKILLRMLGYFKGHFHPKSIMDVFHIFKEMSEYTL